MLEFYGIQSNWFTATIIVLKFWQIITLDPLTLQNENREAAIS